MTKFASAVKVIPASQKAVYEKLSDLSNLEKVKDRLPQDKVQNLSFDAELWDVFNVGLWQARFLGEHKCCLLYTSITAGLATFGQYTS